MTLYAMQALMRSRLVLKAAGGSSTLNGEQLVKTNRIVLQDLASGCYLSPDRSWVSGCLEAMTFEHTSLAVLEGVKHSERRSQIVWCFEHPSTSLYISVYAQVNGRVRACENCPGLKGGIK